MTDVPAGGGAAAARDLLAELRRRGLTAATAESLTGGLVAAEITAVPGASDVFRGGVVAYATDAKTAVLGVPPDLLEAVGPVADRTASAMARAVRVLFDCDLGIATTGVAGPSPVGDIPPGVAYVAAALGTGPVRVRRVFAAGDRDAIRRTCVEAALAVGLAALESGHNSGE